MRVWLDWWAYFHEDRIVLSEERRMMFVREERK